MLLKIMENNGRVTVHRLSQQQEYHVSLERDILIGMTVSPKWFPTKYMYDEVGSALFEQISKEPHYYVYRAETEILCAHAEEIMEFVQPQEMIELGSGASDKTNILLGAMHSTGCSRYVPLEISEKTLRHSAEQLTKENPWLTVDGYLGDFDTDLPQLPRTGRRLLVFLGNTVGNFKSKAERVEFLSKLSSALTSGDALLLGVDLVKDAGDIIAGYADQTGLRRQLSIRAIRIMNEQLGANFEEENFLSRRVWNPKSSSVEMSLVAKQEAKVFFEKPKLEVFFSKGEGFQTGFSTKFSREGITDELAGVGLNVTAWYSDTSERFAVLLAVQATGQAK